MRPRYLIPIMILWAVALTSIAVAQDDDVEQVRSLIERVAMLMQAGDLEPLNDIFAPGKGVHIIEGAGVNHGWAEYRDHHLAPELENFNNFKYRRFAIEPVVNGDMAFSPYRYELSADMESGHLEIEGRGTVVLERIDEKWRIVHSHTSGRRK